MRNSILLLRPIPKPQYLHAIVRRMCAFEDFEWLTNCSLSLREWSISLSFLFWGFTEYNNRKYFSFVIFIFLKELALSIRPDLVLPWEVSTLISTTVGELSLNDPLFSTAIHFPGSHFRKQYYTFHENFDYLCNTCSYQYLKMLRYNLVNSIEKVV